MEVWLGGSLIVTLVAIGKRVHVSVVEKAFGSVSPGELLWGGKNRNASVGVGLKMTACRFSALTSDLSANAQVGVRDELQIGRAHV